MCILSQRLSNDSDGDVICDRSEVNSLGVVELCDQIALDVILLSGLLVRLLHVICKWWAGLIKWESPAIGAS
jgi:hypothetical protein